MIKSRTHIRFIFNTVIFVLSIGFLIGGIALWLLLELPEWVALIMCLLSTGGFVLLNTDVSSKWFPDEYCIDIETSGLNPHTEYLNWQGSDPEKYKQEVMNRIAEAAKVIEQKTSVPKSRLGELQYQPMQVPNELIEPIPGKYSLKNASLIMGNPDYHLIHTPGLQEC